ncbi:transglycosylase domain-containing protein [Bacteriovoracaceae bacterium]|nr:transglycosylase domain-containing protein [Bacteriovoracaceae bacterium]
MSSEKSSFKKKLLVFIIVIDIIIFVPIVWYFVEVPSSAIESLQDSYIQSTVTARPKEPNKYDVDYKIVGKKPKNWVTLKQMNYTAVHAIVVSEDWAFYDHSGYDSNQIADAIQEATEGGRKRGASTISQQLVKNLFFTNDKSLYRKAKEFVSSVVLERNLSKEKILETYLNVIEFAPGVYGIGNASKFYFNKHPKDLTAKEGAFLAMLLPNPKRNMESFKQKGLTEFGEKTVNAILEKMVVSGYLKKEQLDGVKADVLFRDSKTKASAKKLNSDKNEKGLMSSLNVLKSGSAKRKKKKNFKVNYRSDKALQLSDEPEFDEDAILDDNSGLEEEFKAD